MLLSIENEKLQNLIKSFYNLTGIKVAVFDSEFNEILAYPDKHSSFCEMIHKNRSSMGECDKSAIRLCRKCAEEKNVIIENCHAGLTEAVAPLSDGISIIGYIMFGQITNICSKDDLLGVVEKKCEKYRLVPEKLKKNLNEIPYYSNTQLDDTSKILDALAGFIIFSKLAYLSEEGTERKIAEYIKNNLSGDLSVKVLCSRFYLSKTEIYRITKVYMPEGIAAFVKKQRIERAAELLKQTDMTNARISETVGFSDVNYFMKVFKKMKGVSASDYRKKFKKK